MRDNNLKEKLKEVNQLKITDGTTIINLINSLKETGFNAKRLALACHIYKEMIDDKECTKFFGLAGAMVPAGMPIFCNFNKFLMNCRRLHIFA